MVAQELDSTYYDYQVLVKECTSLFGEGRFQVQVAVTFAHIFWISSSIGRKQVRYISRREEDCHQVLSSRGPYITQRSSLISTRLLPCISLQNIG
jgi:hypothetical protein